MKYLHDEGLAALTALLTDCPVSNNVRSNSRTIHGRLEAYTTKRAGSDKKYAGQLGLRFDDYQEHKWQEQQFLAKHAISAAAAATACTTTVGRKRSMSTGQAYESNKKQQHWQRSQSSDGTAESTIKLAMESEELVTIPIPVPQAQRRGRSISLDIPLVGHFGPTGRSWTNEDFNGNHHGAPPPPPPPKRSLSNFKALSWAANNRENVNVVNRRLLTDLILTLNHSFPDYDFCDATASDFVTLSVQTAVTRINERLSELAATGADANNGFLANLWTAVDAVIALNQVSAVYSYQPTNDDHDDPLAFLKASLSKSSDEVYTSHTTNGNEQGGIGGGGGGGAGIASTVIDLSGGASVETDMYSDADDDTSPLQPSESGQVLWTFNYFFVNKQAKRIVLFTCIETMMCTAAAAYTEEAREENTNQSDGRNDATDQSHGSMFPNHSIPEHASVHHDATLLRGGGGGSSGTQKIVRSPSLLSTTSSLSSGGGYGGGGGCALDDDESLYDDNGAVNDNDSTASSAVSVADFDLDPAHAVSGGIAIDTA
jgi:Maf1 regulator